MKFGEGETETERFLEEVEYARETLSTECDAMGKAGVGEGEKSKEKHTNRNKRV